MPSTQSAAFDDAVSLINSLTEHQYGAGPIEDGGPVRWRAFAAARAVVQRHPGIATDPEVESAIQCINGGRR